MSRLLRPILPDGRSISVQEFGDAGEPVLLLPGAGADRLALGIQGRALQDAGYHAFSLDYPGVGLTEGVPLPESITELGEYAIAAADALGLDSFHVIGQSLGSALAQELALRVPSRIRSIVLLATWGRLDPFLDVRGRLLLLALAAPPLDRSDLIYYFLASRPMLNAQKEQEGDVRFRRTRLVGEESLQHYVGMGRDRDRLPRLRTLQLPCLVIAGSRDLMTPPDYSREVADVIDGARFVLLDDPRAAHLFHYEMGEETNREILQFLNGLRTA